MAIQGRDVIALPQHLDTLVVALCADFERRAIAVRDGSVSRRVSMEYAYINSRVHDAASEIVGERRAGIFIREIGERVGYAFSDVEDMSESFYKQMKRCVKNHIARKLHLID